jgi:uncharacterized protein YbjT (DUF2867 family)
MPGKCTILVTGATGAQGGSVASHLLANGKFKVRCFTRKPDSEKAEALRKLGAEVVAGDLGNVESLHAAMNGCYGVFGVTNFWEHFSGEREQGRNLINAVNAARVEHFVFSTLPSVKKLSNGELEAPHFDIKAQLEEYSRELGLPATYINVAFYYENFTTFFPPQKQLDGSFSFGFPQGDTPLAMVSVEDTGGVASAIFNGSAEFIGKTIGVVGSDDPPKSYAESMSRVLGERVVYQHIPREVFAGFGFPGADDLANMFDFNRRFIPNRHADLEDSRRLYPKMQRFEAWLKAHRAPLRAAMGLQTHLTAS